MAAKSPKWAAHPRSRGENRSTSQIVAPFFGSSPLTRGKPYMPVLAPAPWRLIPAHAGKTASERPDQPQAWAHPRSRGENTSSSRRAPPSGGSSPLTRGKRHGSRTHLDALRLIPAHAGKTRSNNHVHRPQPAHPRSRGENAMTREYLGAADGSSPLTRGKRRRLGARRRNPRLIPAHAGKTRAGAGRFAAVAAHPRSRGENKGFLS